MCLPYTTPRSYKWLYSLLRPEVALPRSYTDRQASSHDHFLLGRAEPKNKQKIVKSLIENKIKLVIINLKSKSEFNEIVIRFQLNFQSFDLLLCSSAGLLLTFIVQRECMTAKLTRVAKK